MYFSWTKLKTLRKLPCQNYSNQQSKKKTQLHFEIGIDEPSKA
jgi:hypothetical protein